MRKSAQPMSPKTMGYMDGGAGMGPADPELSFEQQFSDQAMQVFGSKYPSLMEHMVTFKTISSNLEEGNAVGALILDVEGQQVYVPAIMADGNLKPIELVYYKDADRFVPLSEDWVSQIQSNSAQKLGEPMQTPKTLIRNVDLRNVMFPPLTGRYSFASYSGAEVALPGIMAKMPDSVKTRFLAMMEKDAALTEKAWDTYPNKVLAQSLQLSKEANAQTMPTGEKLTILLANDTVQTFKESFGDGAGDAYSKAVRDGATVKDLRPKEDLNKAVNLDTEQRYASANSDGLFRFILADGTVRHGLVICNPISLSAMSSGRIPFDKSQKSEPRPNQERGAAEREAGRALEPRSTDALIIFENGDYVMKPRGCPLASVKITPDALAPGSPLYKAVYSPKRKGAKSASGKGTFIRHNSNHFDVFDPCTVERTSSGGDGTKRFHLDTFAGINTLVLDPRSVIRQPVLPTNSDVGVLPDDFSWISLKESIPGSRLIYDVRYLCKVMENAFRAKGAKPIRIKSASESDVVIDGTRYHLRGALDFLTDDCNLHGDDAIDVVKTARDASAPFTLHVAAPATLVKIAQAMMGPPPMDPSMMAPPPMDPAMGGAPPMDPAMGGMPPEEMPPEEQPSEAEMMEPELMAPPPPPMGPPPPTGVDIAIEEANEQLRGQASALAQAHQSIKTQMETLEAVRARAQELDMGMPPMMPEPPVPVVTPPIELGGPPMEPGTPMEPGSSPLPPGIAPGIEPMMSGDVTPEALGQVADQSLDAAILADLAENNTVADGVANYLPTLEKAMDNAARVLLTLQSREGEIKNQIGDDSFAELETKLRTVIRNTGDLVRTLSERATLIGSPDEQLRDDL